MGRRGETSLIPWQCALVLVALAVHACLAWVSHYPKAREMRGDEHFYSAASQRLQEGADSGLGALWPSFYPRALSWIGVPTEEGKAGRAHLAQVLLLAAAALLLRDIFGRLIAPGLAADLAGFLLFAYPPVAMYAYTLWPEILHLTLLMAAVWILVARSKPWPWQCLLGSVLGLALATKCLLGPVLPLLLLPLVLQDSLAERLRRLALVSLCCAVMVLPFWIDSAARSDGAGVCAASARFNLWVGLLDSSRRSYVEPVAGAQYRAYLASADSPGERHALLQGKIRQRLASRGFLPTLWSQIGKQPFRFLDKDSLLTNLLPGGALERRSGGFVSVPRGLAEGLRWSSYGLYAALGIGASLGLFAFAAKARRWKWPLAAFLGYHSILILVVHVKARFRLPLVPVAIFLSAWALQEWLRRRRDGGLEDIESWRWAWALTASGIFLLLAFGGNFLP